MRRNFRHRLLAYEQLESKAAPSSVLMVVSGDGSAPELNAVAIRSIATESSRASELPNDTELILRFVAEHTYGGERANRAATLPTTEQCAAADEMMKRHPDDWNSLLVNGFYIDGVEL